MSSYPGRPVQRCLSSAGEKEEIHVETEDIEQLLRSIFEKGDWKVEFDWYIGQFATLRVKRTREMRDDIELGRRGDSINNVYS